MSRSRRRLGAALLPAFLLSCCLAAAASPASAAVHTAALTDSPDPAAGFDVATLTTSIDDAAGTVQIAATLHHPLVDPAAFGNASGLHVQVSTEAGCFGDGGARDFEVAISYQLDRAVADHVAWTPVANVEWADGGRAIYPVTVSPDRTSVTLDVADAHLTGLAPVCMFSYGTDQSPGHPTDMLDFAWFAGAEPSLAPGRTLSGCPSPAISVAGPSRIVRGTTVPVTVGDPTSAADKRGWSYTGGGTLQFLTANGLQPFFTHAFTPDETSAVLSRKGRSFPLNADTAGGDARVVLTWDQHSANGGQATCVMTQTVKRVAATTAIRFTTKNGDVGAMSLATDCATLRPRKIVVTVRGGGRTLRFARKTPCAPFRGSSWKGGHVEVAIKDHGESLEFFPVRSGHDRLTVTYGAKRVLTRTLRAVYHEIPPSRVYSSDNTTFTRDCIEEDNDLHYDENGNVYCEVDDGGLKRSLTFLR